MDRLHIDSAGLISMTADDALGKSIAVLGIKGYGKSNTAAVLAEEMLRIGVPICVVDPAGEYWGLKERHSIYVLGQTLNKEPEAIDAKITVASAAKAAERSYRKGQSVILDVSGFRAQSEREEFLQHYFVTIWNLAATLRQPYMIFLEEARNFVPQSGRTAISDVMVDITCEGRKRGLGVVLIGQRSSQIDKNVLTQCDLLFLHYASHPTDVKVYTDQMSMPLLQAKGAIKRLKVGQALVVQGESVTWCKVRPRTTPHKGFTPTMEDLPEERGVETVQGLLL
ncbi:MAG: DUF87 domain-containing protein [Chloroflexi bacterium]|nr:DUF87 domain-containing protein [Chloroflexota bacterium]